MARPRGWTSGGPSCGPRGGPRSDLVVDLKLGPEAYLGPGADQGAGPGPMTDQGVDQGAGPRRRPGDGLKGKFKDGPMGPEGDPGEDPVVVPGEYPG